MEHGHIGWVAGVGLLVTTVLFSGCGGGGGEPEPPPATDGGMDTGPRRCSSHDECEDALFCNGVERCDPESASANALGCVAGSTPCADGERCVEASDACEPVDCADADADGDGHDDPACGGDDCDDSDPNRFPGNVEVCDPTGHDEDCDLLSFGSRDEDGDGYVDARCCNVDGATSTCGTDCDDGAADRYPGLVEVCDGKDNDCDASTDEGLELTFYRDADGDGFGTALEPRGGICAAPDGFVALGTDCDDSLASRNPGAPEVCDERDNDCDDVVDEDTVSVPWYLDGDGDGWGAADATTVDSCTPVPGRVQLPGDCDDTDRSRNPSVSDDCDGVDDDCDGRVDEALSIPFFRDVDGDGFGDPTMQVVRCDMPTGFVGNGTDCDDGVAARNPGAPEVCDAVDNDCDGKIDETGGVSTWYRDADGDGFGDAAVSLEACSRPAGYVGAGTDCDDSVPGRNPGAPEVCDGLDNDCDDTVDESTSAVSWYIDGDGDGWGGDSVAPVVSCEPVAGRVVTAGDCDDTVAGRNPSAPEVCDLIDNDCDRAVDEGVTVTFYRDADGDGFGNRSVTTTACSTPSGYAANDTDCDDASAARNPGNGEACDAVHDNDCNPTTDPFDVDLDGFDDASCGGTDCDDLDATMHPGAAELCDGKDNRCVAGGAPRTVEDADGDGHAPPGVCTGGPYPADDCDDGDRAAYPGHPEVCDGGDNDCDDATDEDPGANDSCNLTGTVGICVGGTCSISACNAPYANCDGRADNGCEADLDTDPLRCGSCATQCPSGATCSGGGCFCPAGAQTLCSGACTDILTSEAHCGGCGQPCPVGATCTAGVCRCDAGRTACGGRCVDTLVDTANCGGCGQACVGGSCAGGVCTCPGSMPEICGGVCRDLAGDTLHCGACGATCFGGSCAGGVCTCGPGEALCDGACIDTTSDRDNCGGCGVACIPGGSCAGSTCSPSASTTAAVGDFTTGGLIKDGCTRSDGSVVLVGTFRGDLYVPGRAPISNAGTTSEDTFVVSLDVAGATEWVVTHQEMEFPTVACDAAGNTYLGARLQGPGNTLDFGSPIPTGGLAIVSAFDRGGAHRWSVRDAVSGGSSRVTALCADGLDRLNVALAVTGAVDFGASTSSFGGTDVGVAQLDASNGAHRWTRAFGDGLDDVPAAIACADDGTLAVGGYFSGTLPWGSVTRVASSSDGFVGVLDADGAPQWCMGPVVGSTRVIDLAVAGGVLAVAAFGEDIDLGGGVVRGTRPRNAVGGLALADGSHLWSFAPTIGYGAISAVIAGVTLFPDGSGYAVLTHGSDLSEGIGYPDLIDPTFTLPAPGGGVGVGLMGFDATGTVDIALLLDGPSQDRAAFVASAGASSLWVGGSFTGTIDLGDATLNAPGSTGFAVRYSVF